MGIVSCAMWQTQMNCLSSDIEDEFARISNELQEMTDYGKKIGERLSNCTTEINQAQSYIQRGDIALGRLLNGQNNSAQNQGDIESKMAAAEQYLNRLIYEEKPNIEAEREIQSAKEKELLVKKTGLETQKKLADSDGKSAQEMRDKAIERAAIKA